MQVAKRKMDMLFVRGDGVILASGLDLLPVLMLTACLLGFSSFSNIAHELASSFRLLDQYTSHRRCLNRLFRHSSMTSRRTHEDPSARLSYPLQGSDCRADVVPPEGISSSSGGKASSGSGATYPSGQVPSRLQAAYMIRTCANKQQICNSGR